MNEKKKYVFDEVEQLTEDKRREEADQMDLDDRAAALARYNNDD